MHVMFESGWWCVQYSDACSELKKHEPDVEQQKEVTESRFKWMIQIFASPGKHQTQHTGAHVDEVEPADGRPGAREFEQVENLKKNNENANHWKAVKRKKSDLRHSLWCGVKKRIGFADELYMLLEETEQRRSDTQTRQRSPPEDKKK